MLESCTRGLKLLHSQAQTDSLAQRVKQAGKQAYLLLIASPWAHLYSCRAVSQFSSPSRADARPPRISTRAGTSSTAKAPAIVTIVIVIVKPERIAYCQYAILLCARRLLLKDNWNNTGCSRKQYRIGTQVCHSSPCTQTPFSSEIKREALVKFFQNQIYLFLGYLDPTNILFDKKKWIIFGVK